MAMTMMGEVLLAADQQTVWAKLNDPETLKACIPGCQSLEKTSDLSFVVVAKNKVGPVSATFKGRVELSELDPPHFYRIQGEGDGGVAGFAKGGAKVRVQPDGAGSKLIYDVEAQVGGKIAQLGARLVDGVAKKMADQFFERFAQAVQGASQQPPEIAVAIISESVVIEVETIAKPGFFARMIGKKSDPTA